MRFLGHEFATRHVDGGSLSASAQLDYQLTLGAEWNETAGAAEFYIDGSTSSNELGVSLDFSATDFGLDGEARLGFVDLDVTSSDASGQVDFNMNLTDAETRIRLSDSLVDLASSSVSVSTQPSLSLEFTSTLITDSQTLTLNWPNVADPTTVTHNLADLGDYADLAELGSEAFTDGFTDLVTFAGEEGLSGFSFLGRPIPTVGSIARPGPT